MDLLEDLQRHVLVADGAMGTELFAAGVARGRCLEELCLSEPELIQRIHAAYLAAGARLVKTNSWCECGAPRGARARASCERDQLDRRPTREGSGEGIRRARRRER